MHVQVQNNSENIIVKTLIPTDQDLIFNNEYNFEESLIK